MTTPGKQNRVDQTFEGRTPDVSGPEAIPGKQTLIPSVGKGAAMPSSAAAIGDPYIENRETCAGGAGGDPTCFLTDTQRTRLINAYQDEVRTAEHFYVIALVELGLERMIQKDAELPAILTLALDAFGGAAALALGKAFRALGKASEPEMAAEMAWVLGASESRPSGRSPLRTAVNAVSDADTGFLIKAGVDAAKKSVKGGEAAGMPVNQDAGNVKVATMNYIDELKAMAAIAFEHQAQDPPGTATDGQLILLFHAFKAKNGHTVLGYKTALTEKIARYLASPVSKIGRDAHHPNVPGASDFQATMRDTQVRYVVVKGTALPVLYYYKRDFGFKAEPSARDMTPGHDQDVAVIDPHMVIDRPVELEFVDTAIAKNREVWGRDPPTEVVDPEVLYRGGNDLNQYVPQNNPRFQPVVDKPAPPPAPPAASSSTPDAVWGHPRSMK